MEAIMEKRSEIVKLADQYYPNWRKGKENGYKEVPTKVRTPELIKALKGYKAKFVYDLPKAHLYEYLLAYQKEDYDKVKKIQEIGRQRCHEALRKWKEKKNG